MTWPNLSDATAQLERHGLLLGTEKKTRSGIPAGQLWLNTSKPINVKASGAGKRGGWYWLSEKQIRDGLYITGAFGIYEGADPGKQSLKINFDKKAVPLTPEERAAIKARQDAQAKHVAALRKQEIERAAAKASHVWRQYVPAGESEYLKRKAVAAHGLRFSPSGNGTIAVPMLRGGHVMGLQIIRGKQRTGQLEKEYFPAGMDKTGAHHQLGRIVNGGACIIAEGYATAATIFEAMGQTLPVVVAFDAGNLLPVAKAIAANYRNVRILVAADDDRVQTCRECKKKTAIDIIVADDASSATSRCIHCNQPHGQRNPGIEAAQNAAHAVNGTVMVPKFLAERRNDAKGPTDFNDLQALEGQHVVRQQIETHLAGLGPVRAGTGAAVTAPRGAGHTAKGGGVQANGGDTSGAQDAMPSVIETDDAPARYSIIYGGKGTLFDHIEHLLVPKSDVMDILEKGAWNLIKARGGLPVVRLSEVGFDPSCTDHAVRCNLWSGWPTTARAGKCELLLSVLEHLCSGEKNSRDLYQYVLRWLAFPIQHPGAKMKTALVFHGPQRVGKNLFFESIMEIYGKYGRIVDQAAVEDKFNDWLSGKLFLIADEVVARNELYHLKNKLKGIVTGGWIRINPKNVAAHDERNHVNLVFLSNEYEPLVLEKDDGRYTVVWTPEKLDKDFYAEVKAEIDAGGIAALHQYLLDVDLGDFNEHTAPHMTTAKQDLIDIGLDSVERFTREWSAREIEFADGPLPFCAASSSDLYSAYKRWCGQSGIVRPREQSKFNGHFVKQRGWKIGHKDRYETLHYVGATLRQRMIIPSVEALTEAIRRPGGQDWRQEDAKTDAQWITDCFFAFRGALGAGQ